MFKNCARAENEICLCQFGLYTGKSHILRTPGYQQQVHPARGRATGEQHCRGWCSGNETAESLGWTQKIHAWGGLQNEIQSTRIFVKSRKLSFPQKLPLETTFHPWNSAAYTCFFFSGWRSADGSAHTASWHIPKHRKHKGSRDLVHHLEIKLSSQACLPRLWLTAAAEHMLGSACKINHKIHTSRTVFLELWEQKDSKQLKHFQNQFSNNNLSSW